MKLVRIFLYVLVFAILFVVGWIAYVKLALPDVALMKDIKIPSDPVSIEHGKYLANNVAVCIDCHSERDWTKLSGPIIPGTEGGGGEHFDKNAGFPGSFYSKNITPVGLAGWSDAEIFRVVTSGVTKNNEAMFPVMPYLHYGQCDAKDIADIIAYIKTLKPIQHEVAASEADFPVSILINTMPKAASFTQRPPESDKIAYGGYLVNMAACGECHTKRDKGKPVEGMEFAGGMEFMMPTFGTVTSVNLTPDKETGIGGWTEESFVNMFRQFSKDSGYVVPKAKPGALNTPMPWTMYGNMKVDDLKAIYAYLQTVKPVKNRVELFRP